ncbi:Uncharacterised protein [Rodentibacter pneumotropicus]|uniref:Uncharacterized protein n=1 Tax=Rodentibacter pneumotropicus TaxID=758 RepID=A0A448MJA9_9PAST|nr:Uncharacterised protein [Rodentibacter pneumotropicus]
MEDITVQSPNILIDTSKLPPSEPRQAENNEMEKVNLPVSLDVKNVTVEDLNLQLDQTYIALEHFQSAVSLNNESGLTLASTEFNKLNVTTVQLSKTEKPAEPKNNQPIDWEAIEQNLTPAF